VTGVRTTRGEVSARTVVLAGGAFSNLLSEQLGVSLPVFPVKGQTLLVTNMWPSPVKANVWDASNFYVVPKRDGRVIVGATEEPVLFLPPYSPKFSPIEEAFSKVKSILRRIGARTREALVEATRVALDAVSRRNALGWFRHYGYDIVAHHSI
jgi:glycine/D-amino acid oxidase-like deaminating enzyme